jgi:uncharacterized membrane protein
MSNQQLLMLTVVSFALTSLLFVHIRKLKHPSSVQQLMFGGSLLGSIACIICWIINILAILAGR